MTVLSLVICQIVDSVLTAAEAAASLSFEVVAIVVPVTIVVALFVLVVV